jgi:hypothetical protein
LKDTLDIGKRCVEIYTGVLKHTLDIALKDTLDIGKRCVERTLDKGH